MKKSFVFVFTVSLALMMGSCKTKESAYKAAYEKAKEKPVTEVPVTTEEVAVTKPVARYTGGVEKNERVTAVNPNDASGLKLYNVVVGSFKNKTNATALKESLEKDGYNVILAQNQEEMYRVIAASFDTRDAATAAREQIKAKFPNRFSDAWLLINQ